MLRDLRGRRRVDARDKRGHDAGKMLPSDEGYSNSAHPTS